VTNDELLAHIESGKPLKVHLTKNSFALIVEDEHHIITEEQACILWDVMPLLAGRADSQSTTEANQEPRQ
jgi:hypothetical protein